MGSSRVHQIRLRSLTLSDGDIIRALRKKFKGHAIRKSVGIDLFAYKGRKALLFENQNTSDRRVSLQR